MIGVPYSAFDECRHDGDTEAAAAYNEDFDELPAPFEVLSHHQRRAVPCQTNAHAHHSPWNVTKNLTVSTMIISFLVFLFFIIFIKI